MDIRPTSRFSTMPSDRIIGLYQLLSDCIGMNTEYRVPRIGGSFGSVKCASGGLRRRASLFIEKSS